MAFSRLSRLSPDYPGYFLMLSCVMPPNSGMAANLPNGSLCSDCLNSSSQARKHFCTATANQSPIPAHVTSEQCSTDHNTLYSGLQVLRLHCSICTHAAPTLSYSRPLLYVCMYNLSFSKPLSHTVYINSMQIILGCMKFQTDMVN